MGLFMIDEKKLLDKIYRWRDDAKKMKDIITTFEMLKI